MISVLCCRRDSVYKHLGVDCWDADRNAWGYDGSGPVIAHPPCRVWARLSQFVVANDVEVANEVVLGLFCASVVKERGGVLEHPATSALWRHADLPLPGEVRGRCFSFRAPQFWWGHACRKESWFFVSGCTLGDLPAVPFRLEGPRVSYIQDSRSGDPARDGTPYELAKWLIEVCNRISPGRAAEGQTERKLA